MNKIKANERDVNNGIIKSKYNNLFFQNSFKTKKSNDMLSLDSQENSKKSLNFEILKPRSHTFDMRKSNNNQPIRININNIKLADNNINNKNENVIFLNTNKLPKIIPRLSLSNFNKKNRNINQSPNKLNNNMINSYKFNDFNKTFGIIGFNGITFNNSNNRFRNTSYKINNINNLKPLDSLNDKLRYKLLKEQLLTPNNNLNIDSNANVNNNIIINNEISSEKDKKNINTNKNSFNSKTTINSNNKYHNIINNSLNANIFKNKKMKLEKHDNIAKKDKEDENNSKNEENNDSFINELNDLLSNVKGNNASHKHLLEQIDDSNKTNESDDDDKEPDPRINFEQISRLNKSRPQTSYGGLNARRKNLQSAMENKNNRPATSNISE